MQNPIRARGYRGYSGAVQQPAVTPAPQQQLIGAASLPDLESAKRRSAIAKDTLAQILSTPTPQSWEEGLAKMAGSGLAGYMSYRAGQGEKEARNAMAEQERQVLAKLLGGGGDAVSGAGAQMDPMKKAALASQLMGPEYSPGTQAIAGGIIEQAFKGPGETWGDLQELPGGGYGQINTATGEIKPIIDAPKQSEPKQPRVMNVGGRLVDETGNVIYEPPQSQQYEPPEAVQILNAIGIDPRSEEGRAFLMSKLQGSNQKAPSGYQYSEDGTLEAIPGGPADKTKGLQPADQFKMERELRGEFDKKAKEFSESKTSFRTMENLAKDGTGASDVALVFSFFKTIDPQSTVREGEFAQAASAMGLGDQFVQYFSALDSGQKLAPALRQQLVNAANTIFQQKEASYNQILQEYQSLATEYNLDPNRIVGGGKKNNDNLSRTASGPTQQGPRGGQIVTDF